MCMEDSDAGAQACQELSRVSSSTGSASILCPFLDNGQQRLMYRITETQLSDKKASNEKHNQDIIVQCPVCSRDVSNSIISYRTMHKLTGYHPFPSMRNYQVAANYLAPHLTKCMNGRTQAARKMNNSESRSVRDCIMTTNLPIRLPSFSYIHDSHQKHSSRVAPSISIARTEVNLRSITYLVRARSKRRPRVWGPIIPRRSVSPSRSPWVPVQATPSFL